MDIWEPKVLRSAAGAHFLVRLINNVGWEMICNYVSEQAAVYLASNEYKASEDNLDNDEDNVEKVHPSIFEGRRWYEVTEDKKIVDPTYFDKHRLKVSESLPLKVTPYFKANFNISDKDIVVVVGGETDGLSNSAYIFANSREGQLIHIPLKNNVESLNSAVALGIIIFEIQRQLHSRG